MFVRDCFLLGWHVKEGISDIFLSKNVPNQSEHTVLPEVFESLRSNPYQMPEISQLSVFEVEAQELNFEFSSGDSMVRLKSNCWHVVSGRSTSYTQDTPNGALEIPPPDSVRCHGVLAYVCFTKSKESDHRREDHKFIAKGNNDRRAAPFSCRGLSPPSLWKQPLCYGPFLIDAC